MLYRENGQFKTTYAEDQQILPIVQDRWFMLALLVFAYLVMPAIGTEYLFLSLVVPFLILAIAAIGLNILVGYCGQISLGTAAFMAVGAYAAYNFVVRVPSLNFMRRAHPVRRHRGAGRHPVRHPEPAHQGTVSGGGDAGCPVLHRLDVCAGQVVHQLLVVGIGLHADRWRCSAGPWTPRSRSYLFVLTVAVVMTLAAKNLVRGHIGRSWMAIRDMDVAAEVIGIRPLYAKLSAFAVSSFYAGVAGALWGFIRLGAWEPLAFNVNLSLNLLFMIIIGGMGSLLGSYFRRSVHRDTADPAEPGAEHVRHRDLDRVLVAPGVDDLRQPDHLLPDRRAARPGAAVGDRQGEAETMAVPALRSTEKRHFIRSWTLSLRMETTMATFFKARVAAVAVAGIAAAASLALPATSEAQQKAAAPAAGKGEQFVPVLVYRTGAYAPNGTPWANGFVDYLKLVNAQGGINGVKITWEECETGYATDRGVECYERLKTKPFVSAFQPLSTGITFALTDRVPTDKIPLITMGYGRSESVEGEAFPWNFPLMGTYWDAADVLVQHVGKLNGGVDKLKGKKIALVYHDSPYGKEPIALLQERAKLHGFELITIPVTHPGVEQKAAWLQIRQNRPDYVFLWGWGVMNSTALARGRGHRISARQDVRRVVGRRRAGCHRRSARTPRATTVWHCSTGPDARRCTTTSSPRCMRRGRARVRRKRSAQCCTRAE